MQFPFHKIFTSKLFSFTSFINAQLDHSLYTIYVTLFIPYLFLLMVYQWHCSTSPSTSQPIDTSESLCIPFFFRFFWDHELPQDERVNLGGHVGYQEGAGEPRICTRQGGDSIQIRIVESDFKSILGSRTILPSNWHTWHIRPLFCMFFICMKK
jgi:hypothetical protein